MDIPDVPTTPKTYKYRGIPDPTLDPASLQRSVEALKEVVEQLTGESGAEGSVRDIINSIVGNSQV